MILSFCGFISCLGDILAAGEIAARHKATYLYWPVSVEGQYKMARLVLEPLLSELLEKDHRDGRRPDRRRR